MRKSVLPSVWCARLALALAAVLLSVSQATAAGPKRASLVLQWQPQAQFAGFYVAHEKGFYREAGVDLTLIPGGQDVVASRLLAQGQAQFATMFLATGLERHASTAGTPQAVVHLSQLVQRSALMLVTRADSGIREPRDLHGRRVSLWDNEFKLQPLALFRRLGITPVLLPQSSTMGLFLRGGVDAVSAMWYNEYHTLLAAGFEPEDLRLFFFRDLDLNYPEDGIYTLEKTLKADPALCRAVVDASLRGWRYAFDHPEEALDIVLARMREAHVPVSRVHQRFMLARMRDVMLPSAQCDAPFGELKPEDFDRVARDLAAFGTLKGAPSFAAFSRGGALVAGTAQ
ncbi:NitT/TauT family transport system substrate-binding protein [Humidesulfovibrio mexicanus]|uniref:Thiamine pyrimidine synthase n=1 Tax=Humidesulfovibrio mexicanus TaxID=147047 RepID=A0A238YX52_9BACT|nr:ABC transporter substrate-binding protein [Humidesulfovibrio mexicanus]SNR75846.1 NitT/TauT family transport system substrate-binding protein [Humidesulfovibrio mexicanus]